jgi:hypothetical protein
MIRSIGYGNHAAKLIVGGSASRPTARDPGLERVDAVHLGKPSAPKHGEPFGLDRMRQRGPPDEAADVDPMTRTFEVAVKALPLDEQGEFAPEALFDFAGRASLEDALARYVKEGPAGEAEAALAAAVDDIFSAYGPDLSLDEAELAKAKSIFMRDAEASLVDEETLRAEPWRTPNMMDLDAVITDLRDRMLSRRQNVMESAGDLGRVLSELVVRAKTGTPERVRELGQFLQRFGEAVDAQSASEMRAESMAAVMDQGTISARADADAYGRDFLSYLGLR